MKYLRYKKDGKNFAGIEFENSIYDLSYYVNDITSFSLESLLKIDIDISKLNKIDSYDSLLVPISDIKKIVCIGLNYQDHADELGIKIPSEPVVFLKAVSSICAANDDIELPQNSSKVDWEIELGIVISKKTKYIKEEDAYDYIAGYTIVNDISERSFQLEHEGQWTKGKSHDTFCPIGPYLVSKDEIEDVNNLNMTLSVDGITYQNSNTKNMHYKVPFIVSYLSQFMTLHAGDVILTGTPPGVGIGLTPQVFLKNKQEMILSIDCLGTQKQNTISL